MMTSRHFKHKLASSSGRWRTRLLGISTYARCHCLEEHVEALVQPQHLKRQRVYRANKGKTRVRCIMKHLWNFLLWDHVDEDYAVEMVGKDYAEDRGRDTEGKAGENHL